MTRQTLEDQVRLWLVAAGAAGGIPNADRAVIIADEDGTRPPLPYLMVRALTHAGEVGTDEQLVDDDEYHVRGQRVSTVGVQAFGEAAVGWLERAMLLLSLPSIVALNQGNGIAVAALGPMTNLSRVLDSHTEVRFSQDFLVSYERRTDGTETETGPELETVVHVDTYTSSDAATRVETVTIDLS